MVGNPYMVGDPHTGWPGQAAGQLWGGQGGAGAGPGTGTRAPLAPPKLAGCLARPPCMWTPHHLWVLHRVLWGTWYLISMYPLYLCTPLDILDLWFARVDMCDRLRKQEIKEAFDLFPAFFQGT